MQREAEALLERELDALLQPLEPRVDGGGGEADGGEDEQRAAERVELLMGGWRRWWRRRKGGGGQEEGLILPQAHGGSPGHGLLPLSPNRGEGCLACPPPRRSSISTRVCARARAFSRSAPAT